MRAKDEVVGGIDSSPGLRHRGHVIRKSRGGVVLRGHHPASRGRESGHYHGVRLSRSVSRNRVSEQNSLLAFTPW